MSDADFEDDFDKAFENFGDAPAQPAAPAEEPAQPVVTPPAPAPVAPKEEAKPNEQPVETPKEEEPAKPGDAPKAEENPKPPETPATPPVEEAPQPLTKDDVTSIIRNLQISERSSGKELETATNDVLESYYPEGLSNDLVDQNTGKVLKTPQDVVEATNGQMSMEDAAQWLMNEQFKLDREVADIKGKATQIAETTINFKRDSVAALEKYDPLFKAFPMLQEKAFNLMMKQTKVDKEKGVILAAPDVLDLYDTYLEPYQLAYEHSTKQPATNATPAPAAPATPAPGLEDRLDDTGDGGTSPVDDPNDFAQQVKKELAKGF